MNQNFNFMEKMAPKILSKEKYVTNRPYSEYRVKCQAGDIMHLFTGMRTPNCQKIGDAIVEEVFFWKYEDARIAPYDVNVFISPASTLSWALFAQVDGFNTYLDFLEYFKHKRYQNGILCYQFELIEEK